MPFSTNYQNEETQKLYTGSLHQRDDIVVHNVVDNSPLAGRVTYASVALFALCFLVACFAVRVKNLRLHNLGQMNVIRALVISVYLLGISFILSAALLHFGVGLASQSRCRAAIILCLVFYVGGKVMMYAFLCERMHAIRQNYLSRWRDNFWLVSIIVVLLGFGTIAIFCFIEPVSKISEVDGKCRIGLPFKITLPLLIYDIVTNTSLTAVFFYLVRPYMRKGLPNFTPRWLLRVWEKTRKRLGRPEKVQSIETNALDNRGIVERVAWKSLAACIAVMGSTVANLSLLFYMRGYEQGWLCFTLCTVDVTWGATVVHYLTRDPLELASSTSAINNGRPFHRRSRLNHSDTTEILEPGPDKNTSLVHYTSQR